MSVMNGFREELIKSLSGINGDFIIYETNDQDISKLRQNYPDAKIVKNYQQRVITSNDRGIEGLLMKSMTLEDFYKIPRLNENLFEIENAQESWAFIGTELARSLDVKVGDSLQISIPGSSMTILGPVLNSHILQIKGKLILMGIGKSGHIAQKISATLSSTGTSSFFIHPTEAAHGDLGMINKKDAVLLLSNSGETKEIIEILPALKRSTANIFTLTNDNQSTIANR